PRDITIAHVAQEVAATDKAAIEHVIDGDIELRRVQQQLDAAAIQANGQRQAELHSRLEEIEGYTANARAARLMSGLGFLDEQTAQPVKAFSGGWRMRLNLAQALMCRSDLLLLDEPTNHLDLDAVIWLQDWLLAYQGTLLLISHDREFLDAITRSIAHIDRHQITFYSGNYSAFERQRAELLANQQAAYTKQQREIKHMHSFVERFRYKASKARQAQSRLKALERMEVIAPAHIDSQFRFQLRAPDKLPTPLVTLDNVSIGYGDQVVLQKVKCGLRPSDRIGLLGRNGEGKSTLIKCLADELAPMAGDLETAQDFKVGYFAQHQLEQLDITSSAREHLQGIDAKAASQQLLNYLGGFGFRGDRVDEPVRHFSGGEKARLVLALLVYQKPNLILLDEPTNHLDIEMRHALTMALQDFGGAIVLVSHDRHLLRTVCDELWLVHDGVVSPFDGDLDTYPKWLAEQQRQLVRDDAPVQSATSRMQLNRKEERQLQAKARKKLQPLREQTRKLEQKLERLAIRRTELDDQLSDMTLYEEQHKEKLMDLMWERAETARRIDQIEQQWLEVSSELEAATSSSIS
ncbi:MAG: ATP-binding cassette domain-containing protein, partial [Gammaproteobacteria bacterium]|nr:ATP-binding cassette domain-containing protein [Gammaproteobacteria bacterium]